MDLTHLPTDKIISTYKRYSLPVHETEAAEVKLQFFYIGTQNRYTEKLKNFFEFGYTATSVESAIFTLKRLLKKKEAVTIPDMIIVEGSLGTESLVELHRFLSTDKVFARAPFIVEGSGLSTTELAAIKRYTFIDELLLLNEFTAQELLQKVNFLKKIKQKWMQQPASCAVELSVPQFPDISSFFRRGLDVLFSSLLLLMLGPVMLLIALIIKLESGGQVLYISKRVGRGYRVFDFYKFRTMISEDEEKVNTQRLTRTGWFLRKTSLDELPQLLNVLFGDLSLVGNRPLRLHEAARFTSNEWAKRFMMPAGMLEKDASPHSVIRLRRIKYSFATDCTDDTDEFSH
jgi:lipopolysaccharide/colanic/teichoic acid biosynthesis glycosyltransferase